MKHLWTLRDILPVYMLIVSMKGDGVYKNCEEALLRNNYVKSIYKIQCMPNGAIASILCSLNTNNEYITQIDNDVEQYKMLKSETHLILSIRYGNLPTEELKTLLKYSGICSQKMHFIGENTHQNHLSFKFIDNTEFKLNEFQDGICRCLITTTCIENNDSNATCHHTGPNDYSQNFNISGKIAVLPKRLPLVRTRYGDIDGDNEFAKHYIGPLVCATPPTIEFLSWNGCSKNTLLLLDDDEHSCIQFQSPSILIRIQYRDILKMYSTFNDTLKAVVYEKRGLTQMTVCKEIQKLQFQCSNTAREVVAFLWNEMQNGFELCEIKM
ncbi:unnamed protein product [Dimorphilus gyrociliatus]|uniref:Uncharacterized protein n=1 Tax=Dimorphilus gyrociliatus TaxID=2664684 RepID=A0A7I8WEI6_9ANNE|nr:unnamed protein product [Dimorphilus gyrociliatus]